MSRQTAMGGAFDRVIAPNTNKWRGDHIMDPKFVQGVFFSSEKNQSLRGLTPLRRYHGLAPPNLAGPLRPNAHCY